MPMSQTDAFFKALSHAECIDSTLVFAQAVSCDPGIVRTTVEVPITSGPDRHGRACSRLEPGEFVAGSTMRTPRACATPDVKEHLNERSTYPGLR